MREKPADTNFAIHDLLRRRWSPRAFASRPIEREKVGSLLEAVRWAASSRNEQPWRLVVAQQRDGEAFEMLLKCLAEPNQPWARQAPLLILVCARLQFADGLDNRHAFYDCGSATACLTVQALSMDLWVHQMAGFSPEKARAAFGVPAEFEPVVVLAVGYYGDVAALPEFRQAQEAAPRTRLPLQETVFRGQWGEAFS